MRAAGTKPLFTRARMVYNRSMEHRTIGILGGTLDPVHLGHTALLRMAKEQLALSTAILLPDGDPPHKHCHAVAEDRLWMAKLAAGDEFTVSDMEVRREGATYTVDTLRRLRAQEPESELVYIIGADTLPNLVTWREYKEVFASAPSRRRGGAGKRRPCRKARASSGFAATRRTFPPRTSARSRPRAAICEAWWTIKWPRTSAKKGCT